MYRNTTLVAGGTRVRNILNVSVTDAAWEPIPLGADDGCRSIVAALRTGAAWKLSHLSDGARYVTVQSSVAIDIIRDNSQILFYVQTASGNDTLECLMLD